MKSGINEQLNLKNIIKFFNLTILRGIKCPASTVFLVLFHRREYPRVIGVSWP